MKTSEWHATVELPNLATLEQAEQILAQFGDQISGIRMDEQLGRTSLTMNVKAADVRRAAADADLRAHQAMATVGIATGPTIRIEVMTYDELDHLLRQPAIPKLVGLAEIASKLDVSRQRAGQITQRDDFPRPVVRLAAGPVFVEDQVDAFVKAWPRKSGRPPAA